MEAGMISCRDTQNIRFVDSLDRDFWLSLDRHISDEEFDRKVRDRMGYVLTVQNVPVGLLRYSLFWVYLLQPARMSSHRKPAQ